MRESVLALVVILLSVLPCLSGKKKSNFPKQIANGRYILVTTYHGGDPSVSVSTDGRASGDAGVLSPRAYPEDRRALADFEAAVEKWGKYKLVGRPEDAELIFVVRKGRVVAGKPYPTIKIGSNRPPVIGSGAQAEVGDDFDTLTIYDGALGIDSAPIWSARMNEGLTGSNPKLLQELRKKVEEAEKP